LGLFYHLFGEFEEVVEQPGTYWLLINSRTPSAAFVEHQER
jgi:hypothetical protein